MSRYTPVKYWTFHKKDETPFTLWEHQLPAGIRSEVLRLYQGAGYTIFERLHTPTGNRTINTVQ